MKNLYTAKAISTGGRTGHVETDDQRIAFDLTKFYSATGTNPEQLFACGYAACFGGALDMIAKKEKLEVGEVTVNIQIDLNEDDKGGYLLAATLDVELPMLSQADAERLVNKTHHVCPYSKATRGNIQVKLKANGQEIKQQAEAA